MLLIEALDLASRRALDFLDRGEDTSASGLTHWSSLFYSFGPSISLPVFQGGALVSNLHLSQAQQQEAALDYRKTVLLALRDVDNALAVYRAFDKTLAPDMPANYAVTAYFVTLLAVLAYLATLAPLGVNTR